MAKKEKRTTEKRVSDILDRMGELEDRRDDWEDDWKEITRYALPRRGDWDSETSGRGKKRAIIYDATAVNAVHTAAEGLQGYITSPTTPWFKLQAKNPQIKDHPLLRRYLQKVEAVLYDILSRSNFYDVISEVFQDGIAIGTSTLYIEQDMIEDRLVFSARHPKEIYIAENRYGRIDTVYRRVRMTAREILKRFPDGDYDDEFKANAEDAPYEEHDVIHAVFPHEDRDVYRIDSKNMKFHSVWILEGESALLRESGYDSFPYIIWRYRKNTDEWYGRGPAHEALPTILAAQNLGKTMIEAAQKSVNPPMMIPAELRARGVRLHPGALNPYDTTGQEIKKIDQMGNYPIGRDREEALQNKIKEQFNVDFFLMLSRSAGENLTATQVREMAAEKAAILGAVVGRLTSELLNPMFDRVFDLCEDAGWLPQIPPQLKQLAGAEIEIDYIGPLAIQQKQFYSTQGITKTLSQVLPLVQIKPQIADLFNWDELVLQITRSNGTPESILLDLKQVEKIREEKAKQQAQMMKAQQQMEMAKMQMDAAKKGGGQPQQRMPQRKQVPGPQRRVGAAS